MTSPEPDRATFLERRFELAAHGTSARREALAGLVTFATLCYILFVQPTVLGQVGMDPGGVLFATCVASAAACFAMGLVANLPIALAPAMGHNFFFAFTICLGLGWSWQEALAANALAGLLFLASTPTGLREVVMRAVPPHLVSGIGAGIGLLIAMVGLQWGGLVVDAPGTLVGLGDLSSPVALLTIAGLVVHGVLFARKVPGAVLIGLALCAAGAWLAGRAGLVETELVRFHGVVGAPPSPKETAFALDFGALFARPWGDWLGVVLLLLFLDLFDTIGSLLGLARQADLLEDGQLPRARAALAADAGGTFLGALLGTSTVTSYVESAAGIASGGRTGLTAVVCGLCFVAALLFEPLVRTIGGGVELAPGVVSYPLIAPVLVLIGCLMASAFADVDWSRFEHALPAFLTALLMPLTLSISDGIAWGFVATSLLGLASGKRDRVPRAVHVLATLFVLRYVFF